MKVRTKVWIDDDRDKVIFGMGRARMLEAIDRLGSMNKAAKDLKMSYRALWGRIKSTERRMGVKMVMTQPGGGKASGSFLTPEGRRFTEDYRRLTKRIIIQADREFNKIFGNPKAHEK